MSGGDIAGLIAAGVFAVLVLVVVAIILVVAGYVAWELWLAPLRELDAEGDPIPELRSYIRRKIEMARDYPRESRIFANEILQHIAWPALRQAVTARFLARMGGGLDAGELT